ncbi:T-complex protein 11-domain-containing protein [Pilobolus umbonatus]|nr:T-complex protein 11-domain-containing protein [Pilobolus umbonatus]
MSNTINSLADYNEKTGFYTIDAVSLHQISKRPFHLERRFNRYSNVSSMSLEEAESKRMAILEERKKKLHQNFQKVKRIAKEREDKRENKHRLLRRSMEIAEINRNQHIERRRVASKNSVERAKCIVLQNKKRSREEQERRKAELESRFQKTEQRRLAHLNRYKLQKKTTHSSTSSTTDTNNPSSPLSLTINMMRTTSLQPPTDIKTKKPSSWSILLKAFRELGLPSPSNQDTWLNFNALGKLIHQAKVIVVTTKILNVALKITDSGTRYHARVLLTAYMTLMCPKEVLHDIHGADEQNLLSSAKQMLFVFENWLRAHGRPGATIARLRFVDAWEKYNILFEAWKARDREQLIQNMIAYYIELFTLQNTLKEEMGDQLEEQLEQVKGKLEKLGGSDAMDQLQAALNQLQLNSNSPRSPQLDEEYEHQQENHVQLDPSQIAQLLTGYTPPSTEITNEQLAHELIVNPEFKLQPYSTNELEKRVKAMAEKAFFDKLKEDIEGGRMEEMIPLIADVKQRLLSLVRPGNSMHSNINEAMDLSLIEQQIRQGAFDMDRMTSFVIDCMSDMCAPVRDEEIQVLHSMEPLERIQKIMHLLEAMSMDLANFRLRSLRPHLMTMAVEYEREKFTLLMNNGAIRLDRTTEWISKAVYKLYEEAARRNPEGVSPEANNKPTHDAIFEEAFVSLIGQSELIEENMLPETLRLDVDRMAQFQNEAQAMTMVTCLIMLAKNFGSNHSSLSTLANTLLTLLKSPSTSIDNLSAEIERSVNIRPENRGMIRTMVDKVLSQTDTIYCLLSRRVSSVIKSSIQNGVFVNDAIISSYGLEQVQPHLMELTHAIMRLCNHHRKVYSKWYDDIINETISNIK